MRYRVLVALVLFLVPGAGSFAVESNNFPLTIVRAEVKTRDRVVYWVVNTPSTMKIRTSKLRSERPEPWS